MSGNTNTAADERTEFNPTQTYPLALSGFTGADHGGRIKLRFDEQYIPGDNEQAEEDLNWGLEAINSIITHGNLCLWARTRGRDLFLAHHPAENHERAGHIRAAAFEHTPDLQFDEQTELDAGLITPFEAVNALYDIVVSGSEYSMILAEVGHLTGVVDHPILTFEEHILNWHRYHFSAGSPALVTDLSRVVISPSMLAESDVANKEHAKALFEDHIEA